MLKFSVSHPLGNVHLKADFSLPAKGVTAIFGRSGAGKSSLINVIAGLLTPERGYVELNGRVLLDTKNRQNSPPEQRRIGYVFQEPRLFPHYRVEQNLTYGCKTPDPHQFQQITELLGIGHLLNRFPASLSGGEKQRVAIGRALLSQPEMLLMDEPLSALDLPRKQELLDYLAELARQIEIPILYVSHSLDEVIKLADYLMLVEKGEVVALDRVETVWNAPIFERWQPEGQRISLLSLPISQRLPSYQMLGLALGDQLLWVNDRKTAQGERVRVRIPSKEVSLALSPAQDSSIRNILKGVVAEIYPRAEQVDVAVEIGEHRIWASVSHWAFEQLGILLKQPIYLQVKTLSL